MQKKLYDLNKKLTGDLKAHDPSLIKENDKWWLFHTGRGVGVKSSNDGLNWKNEDPILDNPIKWWSKYVNNFDKDNDVWAPDLEFFNDKWWLYYSVSEFGTNNSLIGLLSADNIENYNWQDEGLVITSTEGQEYNTIDPNLFIDPDGNPWLVFGSWFDGIKLTKIDPKNMKTTGEIYSLARRQIGKRPAGVEAPTLTYRNGYYYLFISIDHCCRGSRSDYKIAFGRSDKITGPYRDRNGINLLEKGGDVLAAADEKYIGYGGQDIFNNQLLVHHAYNKKNGEYRFFIKQLEWGNGWPKIKNYNKELNSFCKLINIDANKPAAVKDSKTEARTKIVCQEDNNSESQEWLIYPIENGFYRIQNKHSLLYLEVENAEKTNCAKLQQWSNSRNFCQEWKIINIEADIYKIVNRNSGKAITRSENNFLIQNDFENLDSQKWKLVYLK